MPYVDKATREMLEPIVNPLVNTDRSDGEITYIITRLIDNFYGWGRYENRCRGIGVLECAKLEFYRRKIAPYEDDKCVLNGDVFE